MERNQSQHILIRHNRVIASIASASALAILAAAPLPAEAQNQETYYFENQSFTHDECLDKYFFNEFDYVDSLVLASFWNQDEFYDAKVRLGAEMLAYGPRYGDTVMRSARSYALSLTDDDLPVWFSEGGYRYEDAEALSRAWGKSVWESKITISQLLIGGHREVIDTALRNAR
ncbi:MAG: hypothetical protein AAF236_00010 [Verrucomicrobiota bacterium]